MALAITRVLSITSRQIEILFTDDLDPNITVNNIAIESTLDNIPDSTATSVNVEDDVLTITYLPLFPNVQYKFTFLSTSSQNFQTVNGESILENDTRNTLFVAGPGEVQNDVRDDMLDVLPIVYESEEPSRVRNLISSLADGLQRSLDAMSTVRSANYLSVLIEDESIIRDDGPTDKFANGGVFEVLRVGSTLTQSPIAGSINFSDTRAAEFQTDSSTLVNSVISALPEDPISLQAVQVINEEISDDIDAANFFDGLKIRVINKPLIQVMSVTLKRDGILYPYDIDDFGYALLDNSYDTTNGSINITLENNELELSSAAITGLSGAFVEPQAGDTIYVSYIYKRLGRNIDSDSVELSTVKQSIREVIGSSLTSFTLNNAPIVTGSDAVPTVSGVSFLSTQAVGSNPPFIATHPAFVTEISFESNRTPSAPGEFTVDYSTGQVFVYGEDLTNAGTGSVPPVATYYYRKIFTPDIDYTFNSDRDELAIKSTRNISGIDATIRFDYEDTFSEDIDYRVLSNVEVLNERVENRLISDFEIQPINYPVTDAFRIFNETTGEIYNIQRITDTSIEFSGRQAPVQSDITRERARFKRVPQETLLVSDELTNTSLLRVLVINLENSGITDSQRNFIGANYSTSILFSDDTIFLKEKFYEDRLFTSVSTNIDRLTAVGEYLVDYNSGIVYVAVSDSQTYAIGDISYEYKDIETTNDHILRVDNIYRSLSSLDQNVINYTPGVITDTTVNVLNLEQVGERFINDSTVRRLLVGTYQSGEDGVTSLDGYNFVSNSAIFTASDIGRTLVVGTSDSPPVQEVTITAIISTKEVLVSPAFTYTGQGRVWTIIDLSDGATKTITLNYDIDSVQNIYNVEQLGSLPADEMDGYFDLNRDSFSGNIITLGDDNPLQIGDAVVVVYNYGNLYIDYTYLRDELIISYEYGNNSLDWSISSALDTGEEYFVTYKFGALRNPLLTNFGSLTQIPLLTNFPTDFDREVYRSVVQGTLQSFIEGPTIPSIKRLVEAFTDVEPEIRESVFNQWVLGTGNLYLNDVLSSADPSYDLGQFANGLSFLSNDSNVIKIPALANFRLAEGTWETWVRPNWNGLDNDADLVFDIYRDGYQNPSDVYIGFSAVNPDDIPFTLNARETTDISVIGIPNNIDTDVGYFIWFDETNNQWNMYWRDRREDFVGTGEEGHTYSGTISTSGEIFKVSLPTGDDGYTLNEVTDTVTSKVKSIDFNATIDCIDGSVDGLIGSIDGGTFLTTEFVCLIDGGTFDETTFIGLVDGGLFTNLSFNEFVTEILYSTDGISFGAGDLHYIFDMAQRPDANRISLYRDGTGYLNFEVFDNQATYSDNVGRYNLSTYIADWEIGTPHHVAIAWIFNSYNEQDEMHLFVDGMEVPNLFKYGGNPTASSSYLFGDVAEEIVVSSSVNPIIGGFDGVSIAGSALFRSVGTNFEDAGIEPGDTLFILEDNDDGFLSGSGGEYNITGVGSNTLTIDTSLTLGLGSIHWSVNQVSPTITTPINFQDFIVVVTDGYTETELSGLNADEPDYSVERASNGDHILNIQNGVDIGDSVIVKTLGLIFRRCKGRIYTYSDGDNIIRFFGPAPVSLADIDITAILLPKLLVDPDDGDVGIVVMDIGGQLVSTVQTVFDNTEVCQPTNSVNGRRLDMFVSGDNINYLIPGNEITINGTTYAGATSETLTFTQNGTQTTTEYFKTITSVNVSLIPIDATQPVGVVEIRENKPLTQSDNNGDYAEIISFDNGIVELDVFGTLGTPFVLDSCWYEIDYPSFLRITIDGQPDYMYLGSDYNGNYKFDGVIDEVRSLKTFSEDTRIGESLDFGERSITTDYNADEEFTADTDTLLLLHLNDDLTDDALFIDSFNEGFITAPSVNDDFGTAALFDYSRPYIISNAGGVFNNDEGSIEFWVSPLDDTTGDPNLHYYVDMGTSLSEEITSSTKITVVLSNRASEILSVRLISDTIEAGTNYFTGGSLASDSKTITLGTPLPRLETPVIVTYIPIDAQGDRVSVFRDDKGFINFFVKASGVEHLVSTTIDWKRNTWHKVMVMWTANSADGQDRLRLFVDGSETGTIKYGTGLIYGTGIVYGQAEVRDGANRFVVDNIDLTDTFSKIYIGTDIFQGHSARARIDNIRFSSVERLSLISTVAGVPTDLSYIGSEDFELPNVDDVFTTLLLDFSNEIAEVESLANLVNEARGIFRFEIDVIDSFDKVIGNTQLEDLLVDLINVIKPAHTEATVNFIE